MNNKYRTHFIVNTVYYIVAFFLLAQAHSYAQLSLVPIGTAAGPQPQDQKSGRVQAISLPFFDDFATTTTAHPSSAWWIPGGGVYVNNTLATTHPSLNIATFDGLDSRGFAYELANPLKQDFTDTLTSQPVNLSSLSVKDSVYMSFYWLQKGLGEKPDSGDVFRLEFKDRLGGWTIAFEKNGKLPLDSLFAREMILLSNPSYFHSEFQFRFMSRGRSSGAYDTWHLDYVYLNKNRTRSVPFMYDLAMRKPISSFLKQFTAMPMRQYIKNPALFTASTVYSDVFSNKDARDFAPASLTIVSSKKKLFSTVTDDIIFEGFETRALGLPLKPLQLATEDDTLQIQIKLTTTDNTIAPQGVNLTRNDSISAQTILSDFYAYDDGSAEHGIQMNQKLGRTAIRFAIPGSDTITGVKMCLLPFNKNVAGQAFTIQLWNNQANKPGTLLKQQSFAATYPADRNGFIEFKFTSPVVVKDTFYVGWLQINDQPIIFGYDRNSTLGNDKIFESVSNEWSQKKDLAGSIMIRPVTGGTAKVPVLGVETDQVIECFFPNPAQNTISWKAGSLKRIDIYSVSGQRVKTIYPRAEERSANISQIPPGMYIFDAFDGKRNFAQKIVILK